MTRPFNILLLRWNHPLSMIASQFFSLIEKDLFHERSINGTMLHWSKSVLSNACLSLKYKRASFSTVIAIFQNPLWWQMSPTCQSSVALGVLSVNIHLLCLLGVMDLMYSSNGKWSLLPWPSNSPKGVGTSWCPSKALSWSKYLSALVRI